MIQSPSPVLFPPLLLATDNSPSARLAQKLLYSIAKTLPTSSQIDDQALITVLTVKPRRSSRSKRGVPRRSKPLEVVQATEPGIVTDLSANGSSQTADELATTIGADAPANLPISVQVRQGRPATEILNYAQTIKAGLIAVGSRGTGGMRELLLGSVSSVVARYASCSVLVARGAITETVEPTLEHVLLVISSPQATRQAIAVIQQLVPVGIRRVTILCTQPPLNADYLFGPFVAPNPSWQLSQSLQSVQKEQSEQLLQQAETALNLPELDVQTLLQTGEPGPLICQVAQQRQANLIVLGGDTKRRPLSVPWQPFRRRQEKQTDQRPALRNTRLTATEDYTIHHAPCPVLLCRPNNVVYDRIKQNGVV